jgi:hypothetical protein
MLHLVTQYIIPLNASNASCLQGTYLAFDWQPVGRHLRLLWDLEVLALQPAILSYFSGQGRVSCW